MSTSIDPTSSPTEPPQGVPATVTFRTQTPAARLLPIGAVLFAGIALIVAVAVTSGASPSPSLGSGVGASTAPSSSPDILRGIGPLGRGFRGLGGRGAFGPWSAFGNGFAGRGFAQITITAINGSSLSLKTADGWTRTIAVSSSTKVTKAGQTIAASDLRVGDTIRLGQTRNSDGTYTITAIDVVIPHIVGTVSAVTANGFTVKDPSGVSWNVTVSASTTYRRGQAAGARSDVAVGLEVDVAGTQGTGNTVAATSVSVRLPRVFGRVTAKQGQTLTITTAGGASLTVHVSDATTYRIAGATSPTLADITVGMAIIAEGTQRADGSLDATTIAGGTIRRLPVRPNAPAPSGSPTSQG